MTGVLWRVWATMMLPSRSLEIVDVRGKTEDCHDLGGNGDVEAVLARKPVGDSAQRVDDGTKRPVVHVDDAAPRHAALVDAVRVAPVDMIVDHCRQQVVGDADGVEVAGEMEIDVLHGHDLRMATSGCSALDAERGAERRLPQADQRLAADTIERVTEAHCRRRLSLARRGRGDGGDENQPAVVVALQTP